MVSGDGLEVRGIRVSGVRVIGARVSGDRVSGIANDIRGLVEGYWSRRYL